MRAPWRNVKDADVQHAVGNLLRIGVLIAAAVVLVGGGVYLWHHGLGRADYRVFRGEPLYLGQLGRIVRDAASGGGRSIVQLGLLLLIATPVARVAFTAIAFAFERDRSYVLIALLVLALLLKSLAG